MFFTFQKFQTCCIAYSVVYNDYNFNYSGQKEKFSNVKINSSPILVVAVIAQMNIYRLSVQIALMPL